MNVSDTTQFLDSFLKEVRSAGLDFEQCQLDHIAYQASSKQDYEAQKLHMQSCGTELSEVILSNRRVVVYSLTQPISHEHFTIPAYEILEPKENQVCDSGLQHAEFVISDTFEEILEKYPHLDWDTSGMIRERFPILKLHFSSGISLKLHHHSIVETIEIENGQSSSSNR